MKAQKIAAFILMLALFALPSLCYGETASLPFLEKAYENGRGVKAAITFKPGQALEQDPSKAAQCSLLKALRVETFRQKQGDAAFHRAELFVQDKPSLSLTLMKKADECHILSSLLKDQMLSFTRKEFNSLIEFDSKSLQVDLMKPLSTWFGGLASDAKTTYGTFESDKYDSASAQTVYTLTADRIASFLTIIAGWAGKDVNLDRILATASAPLAGNVSASKERIRQAILAMPDAFRKAAGPNLNEPATLTVWQDKSGVVKAAELKARFSGSSLAAGRYVKTQTDGVTTLYSLNIAPEEARETDDFNTLFGMIAPEADSLSVSFSITDMPAETKGDETTTFSRWRFTGVVKGTGTDLGGIGLNFTGKTVTAVQAVKKNWTLNINARPYFGASLVCTEKSEMSGMDAKTDGTLDLYYLPGNQPTCTMVYTVSSVEPEAMPALPKDNVHLDKMNPDELYAWWQETYPAVMEELTGVMESLPK
jgi:hypothetical protein